MSKYRVPIMLVAVLLCVSCEQFFDRDDEPDESGYGVITLRVGKLEGAKSINLGLIKYYNVTIKGYGITTVSESAIPATDITTRSFTSRSGSARL